MGQIIGSAAKPKRCNLNKLSQLGTPAAGDHILVSSDNSMNAAGQGNFDCYIVGDGKTAASALELKKLAVDEISFYEKNAISSKAIAEELRELVYDGNIADFTAGSFVNNNNTLSANSSFSYMQNVDVREYVKLAITCNAQGSAKVVYLDAEMNILRNFNNLPSNEIILDRIENPEVCFISLSNNNATTPAVRVYSISDKTTFDRFDEINQKMYQINRNANADAIYWDIPLTKVSGYVNKNGNFVSGGSYVCAKEVDIEGFSRLCCWGYTYNTIYSALYDENMVPLLVFRSEGSRYYSIDLSQYPTAKYLSLTSVDSKILALGGLRGNKVSDILFTVAVGAFFNKQKIETQLLEGFYNGYRAFQSSTTNRQYKSNVIAVKEGYHITLTSSGTANTINYISYDENFAVVERVTGQTYNKEEIVVPSGVSYYEFFSYPTALVVDVAEFESDSEESENGNILYKKSYVAIGDSFTDSIGTGKIEGGIYDGMSKVYPYIIGNRNRMSVLNQGASGSVLNGYILNSRYNAIPEGVDYITIWYGINDTGHHISVGTVDDEPETITSETSTTTCGGFNWFFRWILTNRPLAKVGVIVTDFCEQTRREAIIACCQKWGIAYLDLYDPTIPMIRTRGNTRYTHDTAIAPLGYVEVCNDAKTLRNAVFASDGASNMHPSNTCHEWQSTIIENFMRGL